jgi:hypothetical protein
VVVEERVETLGAAGEQGQVALENLGKRVVQAPDVAWGELPVTGITPLVKDLGDLRGGDDLGIERLDDQIVGEPVLQGTVLVHVDAPVLGMPLVDQLSDRSAREQGQVLADHEGVFTRQLHLAGEAEVVAHHYRRAGDDAAGERLVVAVADAHHPAVIRVVVAVGDLEQAEVAITFPGHAVRLGDDAQSSLAQRVLDSLEQFHMTDRAPGGCRGRRGDLRQFLTVHRVGAAMEDEIAGADRCGCFNEFVHDDVPFDDDCWVLNTRKAPPDICRIGAFSRGLVEVVGFSGTSAPSPCRLRTPAPL